MFQILTIVCKGMLPQGAMSTGDSQPRQSSFVSTVFSVVVSNIQGVVKKHI